MQRTEQRNDCDSDPTPTSDAVQQAVTLLLRSAIPPDSPMLTQLVTDASRIPFLSRAEVDFNAKALDLAFASVTSAINTRLALLHKRRNNLILPIYTLPNEIFASIIALHLEVVPETPVRRLAALQTVSTKWWDMISVTPSLWAIARLDDAYRLGLKKSGGVPLAVHFEQIKPTTTERLNAFLTDVGKHSHRWKSFMTNRPLSSVLPHLHTAANTLVNLDLQGDGAGPPLTLDLTEFKPLQQLSVENIRLDWNPAAFAQLRSLRILGGSDACLPTLKQLLDVLPSCRELELFELDGTNNRQPIEELTSGWPSNEASLAGSVLLPKLEVLRFINVPSPLVRILPVVQVPALNTLVIRNNEDAASRGVFSVLQRPLAPGSLLQPIFRLCQPKLWVKEKYVYLTENTATAVGPVKGPNKRLYIATPARCDTPETWQQLHMLSFNDPDVSLEMHIHPRALTYLEPTYESIGLQLFPGLCKLELKGLSSAIFKGLLSVLSSPSPEDTRSLRFCCPKLRILHLQDWNPSPGHQSGHSESKADVDRVLSARGWNRPWSDGPYSGVEQLQIIDSEGRVCPPKAFNFTFKI